MDETTQDVSGILPVNRLLKGYKRFKEKADGALYENLAGGQKPHTFVISCSDSRVVPELIFDVDPGELFVLREVGALAGNSVVDAAVEFALNSLGIRNVVLLTHHNCGAVRALKNKDELGAPLKKWLKEECFCGCDEREAAFAHALFQYNKVLENPLIAGLLKTGDMCLNVMIFDIGTYSVKVYDAGSDVWNDL